MYNKLVILSAFLFPQKNLGKKERRKNYPNRFLTVFIKFKNSNLFVGKYESIKANNYKLT